MKKILILLCGVALVAFLAYPVMSHNPQGGKGGCPGGGSYNQGGGHCWGGGAGADLTDEQQEQLKTLHDQFVTDTSDLRKGVRAKNRELRTLMEADAPDEAAIMALHKEIVDLRGQMAEKRLALQLEARKIAPQLKSFRGGKRGGGYHGGYGYRHGYHGGSGKGWGCGPGGVYPGPQCCTVASTMAT